MVRFLAPVTKKDVERIKLIHGTEYITERFNDMASDIDESIKGLTKKNQLLKKPETFSYLA